MADNSTKSTHFAEFWAWYPRKTAKLAAEKAWIKNGCDAIAEKVMAGLKRQLPHWTDAKFIPHPASWLNGGRWDDQLHVEVRPGPAVSMPASIHPAELPQPCRWKAAINRMVLAVVQERAGVPDDVLARLIRGRDHYAAQFRAMWGDNDPGPDDDYPGQAANILAAFRKVASGKAPPPQQEPGIA